MLTSVQSSCMRLKCTAIPAANRLPTMLFHAQNHLSSIGHVVLVPYAGNQSHGSAHITGAVETGGSVAAFCPLWIQRASSLKGFSWSKLDPATLRSQFLFAALGHLQSISVSNCHISHETLHKGRDNRR